MYTGIVQGTHAVTAVVNEPGLLTFSVALSEELRGNLPVGSSVSVDGVCLTVVPPRNGDVTFQAMGETLTRSTLGSLAVGRRVNIERSARLGEEVGGHLISGHVDVQARITRVDRPPNNHIVSFRVPHNWMRFILSKGFIALDGASLTVVDVDRSEDTFTVHFIPETVAGTTFGWKGEGDCVNVEIDRMTQAIVETVEQVLKDQAQG